ncbi:Rpn family recombination-promoting nuclease/putative transposase [Bacillus mycoides]|uniref:Rpn family recombination-promoting nuclease/putative transposase n=1 Tax=Bacillus mycoides TaxID=1405 RepID=UPI0021118B4A|nr:Rpn family recombination-promoting nuclease/putative transposase [Bacillus mycoides]MCQ6531096.1 Rpn family recombination-promoting nuclease/putative transposase [Bacillus mycoides]
MKDRVNLRVDFAFKQLFGTKGNEEILMRFLNEVLQKSLVSPITSVSLEDPHLHKEYKEDKLSIMDVRATLGTGELVNIEIQLANKHDIQKRSLYYWSKLYASQMQRAIDKWDNMSHNQAFRREYEAREKVLLDEKAAVAHAEKKGIEKGREEERTQIIQQMHEGGMTPQNIATIVKMTVEEVQRILHLS